MTLTDLPLIILYTLTVGRSLCIVDGRVMEVDGGECPDPCRRVVDEDAHYSELAMNKRLAVQ